MNKNSKHYELYILLETKYVSLHQNLSEEELFPMNWDDIDNYFIKNNILLESINNNLLVKDTNGYQDYNNDLVL